MSRMTPSYDMCCDCCGTWETILSGGGSQVKARKVARKKGWGCCPGENGGTADLCPLCVAAVKEHGNTGVWVPGR